MKSSQADQKRFSYLLSVPQVILYLGGAGDRGQIQDARGEEQNLFIKKYK